MTGRAVVRRDELRVRTFLIAVCFNRYYEEKLRMCAEKTYYLLGADRQKFASSTPGQLGGHRKSKRYGRLDCPVALRALAKGGYKKYRVFFADEKAAIAAGYRPCARCLPREYTAWKAANVEELIH